MKIIIIQLLEVKNEQLEEKLQTFEDTKQYLLIRHCLGSKLFAYYVDLYYLLKNHEKIFLVL